MQTVKYTSTDNNYEQSENCDYPPLPNTSEASPIDPRPAPSGNEHSHPSSEQVEIQTQKMDQVDFSRNLCLEIRFILLPF